LSKSRVAVRLTGEEPHMRKVHVFNHVSIDGFFVDARGDMS
jgi:hypothetical protein